MAGALLLEMVNPRKETSLQASQAMPLRTPLVTYWETRHLVYHRHPSQYLKNLGKKILTTGWIFLKRLHAQAKFEANRQLGLFRSAFNDKYEKAYKCIDKDWEPLTGFFDFPASQWTSLIERAIQLNLSLP